MKTYKDSSFTPADEDCSFFWDLGTLILQDPFLSQVDLQLHWPFL